MDLGKLKAFKDAKLRCCYYSNSSNGKNTHHSVVAKVWIIPSSTQVPGSAQKFVDFPISIRTTKALYDAINEIQLTLGFVILKVKR